MSKYVIRPVFSLTGRAIGYILPKSVKQIPHQMYKKLIGTYASEEFAHTLVELGIIEKDTSLEFCFEYFNDAIEQSFEGWKLLLILYADLLNDNSLDFLKLIFENPRVTELLSKQFLIFGV